jgi:uracil-DNA glycosylase
MSVTKISTWLDTFPDGNVKLNNLQVHDSWKSIIKKILEDNKKKVEELEKVINLIIKEKEIFPYPDYIFHSFQLTPFMDIKIVILGQDPYFNLEKCKENNKDVYIPQAMGLSFSVKDNIKVPPSLSNIYGNQKKFGHINNIPKHGNLTKWASQGCLMLNSSLTVTHKLPNSHEKYWKDITDNIIKYISDNTQNIVFFLWGGPSLKKLSLIDQTKHKVSISSHPSPLGCRNKLQSYESFYDTDHFGIANKYLEENGKNKIDWNL